jgi:uncharacterized protein
VALPMPADPGLQAPNAKPGGPAQRPVAGPVVPLTTLSTEREELIGGGRAAPRPPQTDAVATRVMTKGEPIHGPSGRGDDFSWPRGSNAASTEPAVADPAAMPAPAAAIAKGAAKPGAANAPAGQQQKGGQLAGGPADAAPPAAETKPPVQRRARPEGLRLPQVLQGLFR